jgi:hypothetical protein
MNIDPARGFLYDLHFDRGETMQYRQKFLNLIAAGAIAFAVQTQAKTPPPKPRPTPTPTPTPMRNTNLKTPMPTPTPMQNPNLKTPNTLPPQILFVDLVIDKAIQTSADFWIVRIRNAGSGDAGPSSLQVKYIVPPAPGGFPGGELLQGSVPTPALKAGAVMDVKVKTPQRTSPEMKARFALNADHTIKESNYANNTTIMPTSPAYK